MISIDNVFLWVLVLQNVNNIVSGNGLSAHEDVCYLRYVFFLKILFSDAIWRHRTWSKLVYVIACCLTATVLVKVDTGHFKSDIYSSQCVGFSCDMVCVLPIPFRISSRFTDTGHRFCHVTAPRSKAKTWKNNHVNPRVTFIITTSEQSPVHILWTYFTIHPDNMKTARVSLCSVVFGNSLISLISSISTCTGATVPLTINRVKQSKTTSWIYFMGHHSDLQLASQYILWDILYIVLYYRCGRWVSVSLSVKAFASSVKHPQIMWVKESHESTKNYHYNQNKTQQVSVYIWWEILNTVTYISRCQYISWDELYIMTYFMRFQNISWDALHNAYSTRWQWVSVCLPVEVFASSTGSDTRVPPSMYTTK